ncbi:MAG: hypothetical protein WBG81_06005, partial [Rhodanobacter sp.]
WWDACIAWTGRNPSAQDVHTIHLRTLSKIFTSPTTLSVIAPGLSHRVSRPFYIAFHFRQHPQRRNFSVWDIAKTFAKGRLAEGA